MYAHTHTGMLSGKLLSVFCPENHQCDKGSKAPGRPPAGGCNGAALWGVKLALLAAMLAVFESAIAKMRVFRVPEFLGAALLLALPLALTLSPAPAQPAPPPATIDTVEPKGTAGGSAGMASR